MGSNSKQSARGSDALEAAVQRYYAPLLSFFRKRTRNAADVEDLVQQVFLRLSQRPEICTVDNPDAYIFQTASNAWRDYWRRGVTQTRVLVHHSIDETVTSAYSDFSSERVLLGEEAVAVVAAALRQLPERTRDVFVLRCYEGLKLTEIARLTGISVRAVEKHMAKALGHLSAALERAQ